MQRTPEWSGPLPPQMIDKAGCDLSPLDPVRNALRLRAYIWPGGQKYDLGRADFHGRWVKWRGVG